MAPKPSSGVLEPPDSQASATPASASAPAPAAAPTPSPPRSPTQKPKSSRNPSVTSIGRKDHAPHHPSGLRQSRIPGESSSPENSRMGAFSSRENAGKRPSVHGEGGVQPTGTERAGIEEDYSDHHAEAPSFWSEHTHEPNVHTRLLGDHNWDVASGCGDEECRHGSFSIRPTSPPQGSFKSYHTFHSNLSDEGFGGPYPDASGTGPGGTVDAAHGILGDTIADGLMGGGDGNKMSTTNYLAKRHGIRARRRMYIFYYVPFFNWIRQYKWAYLKGDLIAAVTMASFYIPMSLSYASNLGHIPPVNGLYSFVFNPFIYALLGTCPQMVVGPEAAGSLLTGQVVRENISKKHWNDDDQTRNAQIAGMTTFMAGAVILLAGIFRLGFLDNVLSRPFLRGFISAIGIVILVDQLIPEMGLQEIAGSSVEHGSSVDKLIFIVRNGQHAHALTCAVSFGALAIIMVCRELKKHLQPRYPSVAYIPDRFIIVVLSAILAWRLDWELKGVDILGDIKAKGKPFPVHFPLGIEHLKNASDAFSTSFVIALLGFFESSVAAKSLGIGENRKTGTGGIKNMHLSANRELVALGIANVMGGLFMALPAFGGYGRSKVNASTGGRTPMSSIFLSLITVVAVLVMLPWFYYLPKGVLSAMISVVAYSLLEEAPPDILFFIRLRDVSSLLLMSLIFLCTIFWNLKIGIAVGIGLSILRVLKHSTRPRIQILGRVPGTTDKFENAERAGINVEFVEGVLIVKIPEPLTFANTGDLKARLRRLEEHGTGKAHPALPPVRRSDHNRNVVFDIHGVTSLDGAGAQILMEIVRGYRERGVRVFFCRVPGENSSVWLLFERSGIIDLCGGQVHFVNSVAEALRLTELEELQYGTEDSGSRANAASSGTSYDAA